MLIAAGAVGRQLAAHFLQRHALHDHAAGTGEGGEEQSFAAEQRGPDAARKLDVVIDGFVEGHDAAGIDLQRLARGQRKLDEIAAAVDEDGSRSGELLQDESFAAEESRAQAASPARC